jgi:hypothetical protein
MADPRAFISFDFDHNEAQRNLFAGQSKNSRTPFSVQDWSSKNDLAQSQWQQLIREKINRCHLMIVLVGRSMVTASGVEKEIAMAKDLDVPYFGVYVDGANSQSTLPKGLARDRTIVWDWAKIASAIDQVMVEGKNKTR